MKTGLNYIVTKQSNDETFRKGDHIRLEINGSITCLEAGGWIDKEDLNKGALEGIEVELDKEWANCKIDMLKKEIKNIEENYF